MEAEARVAILMGSKSDWEVMQAAEKSLSELGVPSDARVISAHRTPERLIRFLRAAVMEALRQDYVRTARAKGVSRTRVVLGHALRNAMIPVVTILALNFGTLFSGALITETMFGWLGMGKTIYDAILGNDFNLALVGLLFATLTTLLANLLADLCYAWLDPRVSYK